ncbi:ABC transporter ATP-binding protein [Haloactinomyces albus]|uniref:ABC-2 type transport system ATP-binding protein n=1 Tax=Haloactinomyces albus TaxID=1352928 RepID=A0AAE4CQF8_9ACTN|nr:ABC transporter ATP-binding protein [Haloactinomyces albus]MDR7302638.1 ABC-2 type transport system ATP-binding protein [Haloactinomyces albus]
MHEHHARAVDVSKDFGTVSALDSVSLDVAPGELVGLLGPNGAGKTTLLNLLIGLRTPTSGRVELFGGDPRTPRNRLSLGVTPQQTGLPETLRVHEIVDFVGGHYRNPLPTSELLEQFGLTGLERRQSGSLSGGQKRRLTVALALVGRPELAVLDEPTTGLDVEARHVLWEALRHYHALGGSLLLTSHYLEEIEALARRVVVIDQGRVLADGSQEHIKSRVDTRTASLRSTALPELPGVVHREHDGDRSAS